MIIVCLGDSLTEGFTPKGTKNDRWAKADTGQAGKRESRKTSAFLLFNLGQQFCLQNGGNFRNNLEIGRKGIVFVAILCYTVCSNRLKWRTLRFPK